MSGRLSVEALGKAYRFYPSRWARLAEWLLPGTPRHELHWVLRDVSFSVAPGESVGIIGRNGAGKSTLLKLITGTTQPSEGRVRGHRPRRGAARARHGLSPRVHGPRERRSMTGQLLGLSAAEIAAALPQIESFAEIGRYIDEPLRTYSSGMQVRLAFSVATALRPDILIVDEALAVGDLYFQHKCYARIRQFRAEGMTLLFVSHDPGAIKSLCDRAILLDAGGIRADDRPDTVLDYYNALVAEQENAAVLVRIACRRADAGMRSGDRRAVLLDVALLADEQPAKVVRVGQAGPAVDPIPQGDRRGGPDGGLPDPRPPRQRCLRHELLAPGPERTCAKSPWASSACVDCRHSRAQSRAGQLQRHRRVAQRHHASRGQLRLVGQGAGVRGRARTGTVLRRRRAVARRRGHGIGGADEDRAARPERSAVRARAARNDSGGG